MSPNSLLTWFSLRMRNKVAYEKLQRVKKTKTLTASVEPPPSSDPSQSCPMSRVFHNFTAICNKKAYALISSQSCVTITPSTTEGMLWVRQSLRPGCRRSKDTAAREPCDNRPLRELSIDAPNHSSCVPSNHIQVTTYWDRRLYFFCLNKWHSPR